jgi:hypothetical protein
MISKGLFSIVLGTVIILPLCSNARADCVCLDPNPPCQAIGAQFVFLGTVSKLQSHYSIIMKVDKVYKGTLDDTIEVLNDILCPGPPLKLGKQYLIYTGRTVTGIVAIHQCSRIRGVDEAKEDFSYLSQYISGSFVPYLAGTVRSCKEKGIYKFCNDSSPPLKGIKVTLSGEGKTYEAITNNRGEYLFSGKPAGEYDVEIADPRFKPVSSSFNSTLVPNGCSVGSFLLEIDRRVQGVVRNTHGEPVEGAHIEMEPIGYNRKDWPYITSDITDKEGKYKIEGLPHGRFYLGVNIIDVPTKNSHYPSTYYPNVLDKNKAVVVAIPQNASVQNLDIVIPYNGFSAEEAVPIP